MRGHDAGHLSLLVLMSRQGIRQQGLLLSRHNSRSHDSGVAL